MLVYGLLVLAVVLAAVLAGTWVRMKQYKKVAPNEVLVVSSAKKYAVKAPDGTVKQVGYKFVVGGGAYINPFKEKAETMVLEVISVTVKIPEVMSGEGVPILAEASAQVRIDTNDYPLTLAIEQFLGSGADGIRRVSETVLEGAVRAVIGTMTVEEITKNRIGFAEAVEKFISDDFARMGLQMVSFALRDVSDTQGYLDALSRPKIAAVKLAAQVAQAEADRDAAIQAAESRKQAEIARLAAEASIAGKSWENEGKKADSQVEVNKKKAHADMSYELERHKIAQSLKKEEHLVKKIEKENAIVIEELEIARKQKELDATVVKPADARKYQIQSEAEAESFRLSAEAKGKSVAKTLESDAQAESVKKLGAAEAAAIADKAKAYGQYNQAAVTKMMVDMIPELAKAVAEPLSRVEKVVLIGTDGKTGASKITGQVAEVMAQMPEVVESVTGIDLKKIFKDKLSGSKE
jgi:flotillin